jgi:mono/diheme cytochrome c family protein
MSRFVILAAVLMIIPTLTFAAGDAAKGKDVYTASCKKCHGEGGVPAPAMAKMTGVKALNDKDVQAKSDAVLKKEVKEGFGKMKPVAIADPDLDNVIAYVRTLK